jgi:gliding motility-associated-like protein
MVAGFTFQNDICVGDCITFTDTTTGNPVDWQWDFGSNATPQTVSGQDPGTICFNAVGVQQIQLTTTDAGGNSSSVTNNLTVHDVPTVTAELDTIIDLGGNVDLIATSPNFGSYQWTPSTYYIDCDTCATTFATPALDVDYIVIFTDPNGCTAQDTVSVEVNFIEGIGVPQAFSPNGDGHNDLLVVKGLGIDKMVFKIYNRYGELIFESQEQTFGWDGTYKGKDENPGVFTWVLEYHLLNGTSKIISGNTTLIR